MQTTLRSGCTTCAAIAYAHRPERPGVEALAGLFVHEDAAADVHGIRALGLDDRAGRGLIADLPQDAVVAHGHGVVVHHLLDEAFVFLDLLAEQGPPRRIRRESERLRRERRIQLADDGPHVADEADSSRDVAADLRAVDVDLDRLHVRREARREPEMHDPVEPRADQDDDVGLLQGGPTRRRDRERVLVVDDPLAHR
jgi:hypothetical protein